MHYLICLYIFIYQVKQPGTCHMRDEQAALPARLQRTSNASTGYGGSTNALALKSGSEQSKTQKS